MERQSLLSHGLSTGAEPPTGCQLPRRYPQGLSRKLCPAVLHSGASHHTAAASVTAGFRRFSSPDRPCSTTTPAPPGIVFHQDKELSAEMGSRGMESPQPTPGRPSPSSQPCPGCSQGDVRGPLAPAFLTSWAACHQLHVCSAWDPGRGQSSSSPTTPLSGPQFSICRVGQVVLLPHRLDEREAPATTPTPAVLEE